MAFRGFKASAPLKNFKSNTTLLKLWLEGCCWWLLHINPDGSKAWIDDTCAREDKSDYNFVEEGCTRRLLLGNSGALFLLKYMVEARFVDGKADPAIWSQEGGNKTHNGCI